MINFNSNSHIYTQTEYVAYVYYDRVDIKEGENIHKTMGNYFLSSIAPLKN
jgi:hypothetical protein